VTGVQTCALPIYDGLDTLLGGNGNDQLSGDAGNDVLSGANGDDVLSGGNDDDLLLGGNGVDALSGGAGNDTLSGGLGDDRYVFAASETGDTIQDWGTGDLIAVTSVSLSGSVTTGTGTTTGNGAVQLSADGTRLYVGTNGTAGADVTITFSTAQTLADFTIASGVVSYPAPLTSTTTTSTATSTDDPVTPSVSVDTGGPQTIDGLTVDTRTEGGNSIFAIPVNDVGRSDVAGTTSSATADIPVGRFNDGSVGIELSLSTGTGA
jgi:hypothetical protein